MESSSILRRTAIIVTTYNPDYSELLYNIKTYYDQVPMVLICDNSDLPSSDVLLPVLKKNFPRIEYHSMEGNKGISAAQNQGVAIAMNKGYKYFIEMDQDSKLRDGYVDTIIGSYIKLLGEGLKVGGIGPLAVSQETGLVYHGRKRDMGLLVVDKTLSSGFFYSVELYRDVGGKDESLFIDYVDWEWCWRAGASGYSIYVDTNLEITHMLGAGHVSVGTLRIGIPSPVRHYYQYRNSFYLLFKRHVPFAWKVKRMVINVLKLPFYAFALPDSRRRRYFIALAFRDVLSGKLGKLNDVK